MTKCFTFLNRLSFSVQNKGNLSFFLYLNGSCAFASFQIQQALTALIQTICCFVLSVRLEDAKLAVIYFNKNISFILT